MPKHSTYEQYWQEHEAARNRAIARGRELIDAIGSRDQTGRALNESEGAAPQERVEELHDDYTKKQQDVDRLEKEFGDAQTKASAIELDAAAVGPNWAASLEARQRSEKGKIDEFMAFVREKIKGPWEKADDAREGVSTVKESVERA